MRSPREKLNITIQNTTLPHADTICKIVRRAFFVDENEPCDDCMKPSDIAAQIERFADGQFVALLHNENGVRPVGMAATMRKSKPPPVDEALSWMDAIGALTIPKHDPQGEWLYGVEMAVDPAYQGKGIGTKLYQARFDLVKRLNLKGWYAVGMLMGYHRVADDMSVRDYGEKVIRRDLIDPTVTMQMNRGFEAHFVVEDYLDEPPAGDAGVLIVWKNPAYQA